VRLGEIELGIRAQTGKKRVEITSVTGVEEHAHDF